MIRRLHLASGLVLFLFVISHLLNHSTGLISLEALAVGHHWFYQLWGSQFSQTVLYGAFTIHIALAFWSIYRRRVFRLTATEWAQLLLGFTIPVLLLSHFLNTRVAYQAFGQFGSYQLELLIFFILNPILIYKQMVLVVVVWSHGVIGIHRWLRLKPLYRRFQSLAFSFALLFPSAALAGIWAAGRDVQNLALDPQWIEMIQKRGRVMDGTERAILSATETYGLLIFGTLLIVIVGAHFLRRQQWFNHQTHIEITYSDGHAVMVPVGMTVLEASKRHNIPHASVCGGRGRCSTCRVRVSHGVDLLATPEGSEAAVLKRIGSPENVRLACQIRPMQDCTVTPLLPASTTVNMVRPETGYLQGHEREIVVLFADLRGFTSLSEHKLPFDVVFVLNSYFAAMGRAITQADGFVDKFVGDGVMALFGLESDPDEACRSALKAIENIAEELVALNQTLQQDLSQPLRLGIGLHCGPAIVGKMGYEGVTNLTAIGDTVNTASRLESAAKSKNAQLVVSKDVADKAGVSLAMFPLEDIEVRGRKERLCVHVISDISMLRNSLSE